MWRSVMNEIVSVFKLLRYFRYSGGGSRFSYNSIQDLVGHLQLCDNVAVLWVCLEPCRTLSQKGLYTESTAVTG